jgi:hypothetical protein
MKDGNLMYNGRPLSLIGSGMSRLAYSDRNGICVKMPVKGREEAGSMQNRAEAECLTLGADAGIFPKFYSLSEDGLTLAVEECPCLHRRFGEPFFGQSYVFQLLNENILRDAGNVPIGDFGCSTALQRVAWGARVFDACSHMPDLFDVIIAETSKPNRPTGGKDNDISIAGAIVRNVINGKTDPWSNLVRFWNTHRNMVILQEMWHDRQWGVRPYTGEFVVIDAGFTKAVQASKSYQRDAILLPPDKAETGVPGMFCGKPLSEVFSPKGAAVAYNFKTSKGSEYVLAEDRMSQRVKKAGLADDGLHRWMDRSVFVEYKDLEAIMKEFDSNFKEQRPTRLVEAGQKWLALQTLDSAGKWYNSLCLPDAVRFPVKGRHVCEFMLEENNIVKCYHPGHDVTEITELKCQR